MHYDFLIQVPKKKPRCKNTMRLFFSDNKPELF